LAAKVMLAGKEMFMQLFFELKLIFTNDAQGGENSDELVHCCMFLLAVRN